MTGILCADNTHDTLTFDDLAGFTPALNRSSDFHDRHNLQYNFVRYDPAPYRILPKSLRKQWNPSMPRRIAVYTLYPVNIHRIFFFSSFFLKKISFSAKSTENAAPSSAVQIIFSFQKEFGNVQFSFWLSKYWTFFSSRRSPTLSVSIGKYFFSSR